MPLFRRLCGCVDLYLELMRVRVKVHTTFILKAMSVHFVSICKEN